MERSCTRVQSVKYNIIILKLWEAIRSLTHFGFNRFTSTGGKPKIWCAALKFFLHHHNMVGGRQHQSSHIRLLKSKKLHKENFIPDVTYLPRPKYQVLRFPSVFPILLLSTSSGVKQPTTNCALMPILFARLLVIYWCVSSFFNQPWAGRHL